MNLEAIKQLIDTEQQTIKEINLKRQILSQQLQSVYNKLEEAQKRLLNAEKARELLNQLVDNRKRSTLDKIEAITTQGLCQVFDNPNYKFTINTKQVRKQVLYGFELTDGNHVTGDLIDTRGGGVVSVVSFLLAVIIQLMMDKEARFFVIDEKFAHVSARAIPNVVDLLNTLADKLHLQFLIVSHQEELVMGADTAYRLSKNSAGETQITKLT